MIASAVAGCDGATGGARAPLESGGRLSGEAPADAPPGTCWDKSTEPAILETVTAPVLVIPEQVDADGVVINPAIYRNAPTQKIVQERRETWFETPCDDILTESFIASLQRALAARMIYNGPVTGRMDTQTRSAIRRFQEPDGILSDVLSLASARKLGLVTVPVPTQ